MILMLILNREVWRNQIKSKSLKKFIPKFYSKISYKVWMLPSPIPHQNLIKDKAEGVYFSFHAVQCVEAAIIYDLAVVLLKLNDIDINQNQTCSLSE